MAELHAETVLGDRYVLHEVIGEGGIAVVWRATDTVLDRPVAVKALRPDLAGDPAFVRRFGEDAVAAARLTHPNVVSVYDTGTEDGTTYIVMEMLDGETLRDVLDREGPLHPDRAIDVTCQVLAGLAFAHEHGMIHRDLKPENVLVARNGRVKVMDFGIARAAYAAADPATTGSVLGSIKYLSPEQVEGAELDGRSDVYTCGLILYECLTGRPPFEAETGLGTAMMRLTRDPLPPRAVRPGISRPLEQVVLRAMARDPEGRFASAEDTAAALGRLRAPTTQVIAPIPPAVPSEEPDAPGGPGTFRSWMLVPLLAVLVAAAVIAGGLVFGRFQLGGPLGVRLKPQSPTPPAVSSVPLRFAAPPQAFDPFGDHQEHDELAPLAADGDRSTYWETSDYRQLDMRPKPGVGLLFDLGRPVSVTGFQLITPFPGWRFEVRVGDSPNALANGTGPAFTASSDMRDPLTPVTGRYVLLWVTQVVPTPDLGNRATVAEFQVFGG